MFHRQIIIVYACTVFILQKVAGYWAMGRSFRGAFVVLDALQTRRDLRAYFAEDYHPERCALEEELDLLASPGLSAKPVYEACKLMEAQYYHLDEALALPR